MTKRTRIITAVLVAVVSLPIIGYIAARTLSRVQSTTIRVAAPFTDVVSYLSREFRADLTKPGLHVSVRGVPFLATNETYFVEVYDSVPGRELFFQARFGQIGNEYNTFRIRSVTPTETEISVNQFAEMALLFSSCREAEREMLDTFTRQLVREHKEGPEPDA